MNYKILKEYEQNLMRLMDILGPSSTDDVELNILGVILFGGDAFKGVYSSNTMPILKNNEICIVITDPDYKMGYIGVHVTNIIIKLTYMIPMIEMLNHYLSIGSINITG